MLLFEAGGHPTAAITGTTMKQRAFSTPILAGLSALALIAACSRDSDNPARAPSCRADGSCEPECDDDPDCAGGTAGNPGAGGGARMGGTAGSIAAAGSGGMGGTPGVAGDPAGGSGGVATGGGVAVGGGGGEPVGGVPAAGGEPQGGQGGDPSHETGGSPDATTGGSGTGGFGGGSGGTSAGGSAAGGTGGSTREVDCSDSGAADLVCGGDDVCCAVPSETNYCATQCDLGIPLACDGPEDCGGRPCCLGGSQTGLYCATGPECDEDDGPLCEVYADCGDSYLCCTSTALGGVYISFCAVSLGSCF